jgi:hypothetical protein
MKRRNEQIRKWKTRQLELVRAIEYSDKLKSRVIEYHSNLESAYKIGQLSYPQFKERCSNVLEGQSVREWTRYYDKCIRYYKQEYHNIERQLNPPRYDSSKLAVYALLVVLVLSTLGIGLFASSTTLSDSGLFGDSISGFAVDDSLANTTVETNLTQEEIDAGGNGTSFEEITAILPVETPVVNETVNLPIENETIEEVAVIEPIENETVEEVAVIGPIENETVEELKVVDPVEPEIVPIDNETIERIIDQIVNKDVEVENVTVPVIISEEISGGQIIAGKPVLWKKRVIQTNETSNVEVSVPKDSTIVGIKKVEQGNEVIIPYTKVSVNNSGVIENIIGQGYVVNNVVPLSSFSGLLEKLLNIISSSFSSITGFTTIEEDKTIDENITLVIEELTTEVVVEYYTEAPSLIEEETISGKIVTVGSKFHYENVLTYSYIDDIEFEGISLYWLVNDTRKDHSFTAYDTNNNGLVDYIEWNTPHLSNESFEIDLDILDVKSYPVVGGNWTVRFNTTGTANLSITTYNGTNWSNINEDNDLKFLDLKCGNQSKSYEWINNTLEYNNYSCTPLSYEISKVLTTGEHTLRFQFGDVVKYAYNNASGVSLNIVDGTISFGEGYFDPTCGGEFATLYSNGSRTCWVNTTAYPTVPDIHIIENNGTLDLNLSVTLQNLANAEAAFCNNGVCKSNDALIEIETLNQEANSCGVGLAQGYQLLADNDSSIRARQCDELKSAAGSNELKTNLKLQVPYDQAVEDHNFVLIYEVLEI